MIHSQRERRDRGKRCDRTFSATKGTALYRAVLAGYSIRRDLMIA